MSAALVVGTLCSSTRQQNALTSAIKEFGALRRRHHEQLWCLTLATNAIVCWSTEYHGLVVGALRRTGRDVDDEVLAHLWPTHHENVHFYGTHSPRHRRRTRPARR